MSVASTAERMADMWQASQADLGIKTVFRRIPRVLLDSECPAVVFFWRNATYDTDAMGDNEVLEERLWEPTVFIRPAYQGTETSAQTAAEDIVSPIRDFLLSRPGLEIEDEAAAGRESVYDARLISDAGYQVVPYPINDSQAKDFAAVVFQQRVREVAAIAYQD